MVAAAPKSLQGLQGAKISKAYTMLKKRNLIGYRKLLISHDSP